MDNILSEPLMNTEEAADYLRIGKARLIKYRQTNEGPPYYQLGRSIRYAKKDIVEWLRRLGESQVTR